MTAPIMDQVKEAVDFVQKIYPHPPHVGIVLGSGLGNFTDEIKIEKEIAYSDIPHFPVSTVEGHKGKLIFGSIEEKKHFPAPVPYTDAARNSAASPK